MFTQGDFLDFCSDYYIPEGVHPELPDPNASIADFPARKVGVYARFFEFANQRIPLSRFLCDVLSFYEVHILQLHCIGAAKLTNFEINCRLMAINPTVNLFRALYHRAWSNGWISFAKRSGRFNVILISWTPSETGGSTFSGLTAVFSRLILSSILKVPFVGMSALSLGHTATRMRRLSIQTVLLLVHIRRSSWCIWASVGTSSCQSRRYRSF